MYTEDEKNKLMEELKEMESLKVDTGDEGKILQNDLIDFITNGNGDKEDLIFRIELFTYAFKLFSRKEVKFENNQFFVYLNDSILDFEKIDLIKKDLDKFELVIEAVRDNGEVLINLNFTYHY
ncbi:MAG: hypothetical protein IJP99_02960 [Methanobrevibacter sp.]|uniref:Uncharacterized protein n=1 Tax=Methanobrevibacter millerae TaxID=230361 RepID=A0A8T3V7X7_9EURY|nr:hypothetical protein [Methanobrevibacter millerae]MBE6504148.1 hypothetical protein [Methanobrevibacter millerae]MBR0058281.1 hypothetical protein [Methanobrevibacter sp.]